MCAIRLIIIGFGYILLCRRLFASVIDMSNNTNTNETIGVGVNNSFEIADNNESSSLLNKSDINTDTHASIAQFDATRVFGKVVQFAQKLPQHTFVNDDRLFHDHDYDVSVNDISVHDEKNIIATNFYKMCQSAAPMWMSAIDLMTTIDNRMVQIFFNTDEGVLAAKWTCHYPIKDEWILPNAFDIRIHPFHTGGNIQGRDHMIDYVLWHYVLQHRPTTIAAARTALEVLGAEFGVRYMSSVRMRFDGTLAIVYPAIKLTSDRYD